MADAVYINVNTAKIAKTIKNQDRFLVDVDKDGNVVGFEILDVSSQQGLVQTIEKNIKSGVPVTVDSGTPSIA